MHGTSTGLARDVVHSDPIRSGRGKSGLRYAHARARQKKFVHCADVYTCSLFLFPMAEQAAARPDYQAEFKSSAYYQTYYEGSVRDAFRFPIRCYHSTFESLSTAGLRVLDYGSGPSPWGVISAATKASEIVLSDYTDDNCKALRQWLEKDPGAFDWSPYFSYIVGEVEGKGEGEAEERKEQVRRLVKAVVHCDLTQDPPIESSYAQPYDVVICTLVLEVISQTPQEYKLAMLRLANLVKPGGLLLVYGAERKHSETQAYYFVGEDKFPYLSVTAELAEQAMREAGMKDVVVERVLDGSQKLNILNSDVTGRMFLKGTKAL